MEIRCTRWDGRVSEARMTLGCQKKIATALWKTMHDSHSKVSRLHQKRIYFAWKLVCWILYFWVVFRKKIIDNPVSEIGQKLFVQTTPEKGYIGHTTIRVLWIQRSLTTCSVAWVVVGEGFMSRPRTSTTFCQMDGPNECSAPLPDVLLVGSSPLPSASPTIQSAPAASGRELPRNLLFAKQRRPGRSIWVIYLWLKAVKEPVKSKRRMVCWQILLCFMMYFSFTTSF